MSTDAAVACRRTNRRKELRDRNSAGNVAFNGIDYVEFETGYLLVFMQCDLNAGSLAPINFRVFEDVTRQPVGIKAVCQVSNRCAMVVHAELCSEKCYVVELVPGGKLFEVDPQFRFCPFTAITATTEIDPQPQPECPAVTTVEPSIDYLARDYGSFRRLLLDRLALVIPEWQERHVPDLGVALMEILAYVGDYLSYYQDAVATEAYLATARQRISVRRHARLVDYTLHEGCNARTLVQLIVNNGSIPIDPQDAFFITQHPDPKYLAQAVIPAAALENLADGAVQPFELVPQRHNPASLSVSEIVNPIGLIGWLAGYVADLSHATDETKAARDAWGALSAGLRQLLTEYLATADAPPAESLVRQLVDELRGQLAQHRIATQTDQDLCPAKTLRTKSAGSMQTANSSLLCNVLQKFIAPADQDVITAYPAHNAIKFYTWSQAECCIPVGATRATLDDSAIEPRRACPPTASPPPVASSTAATHNAGQTNGNSTDWPIQPCNEFVINHLPAHVGWTLAGLAPGQILIFEEALGPKTQLSSDADPSHRQAVRLSKVTRSVDLVGGRRIVEIEWRADDALRFPVCVSSIGPAELGCQYRDTISVARGNVVLVDHGLWTDASQWLGTTPELTVPLSCDSDADASPPEPTHAERFRMALAEPELTFASSVGQGDSATKWLIPKPHQALPALEVFGVPTANELPDSYRPSNTPPPTLIVETDWTDSSDLLRRFPTLDSDEQRRIEAMLPPEAALFLQQSRTPDAQRSLQQLNKDQPAGCSTDVAGSAAPSGDFADFAKRKRQFERQLKQAVHWTPVPNLLGSNPTDRHVVVEMDNDRYAQLRFGDNELGQRPAARLSFYARYRRGSGAAGNIGADKLKHLVFRNQQVAGIDAVRNPLAAAGGTSYELLDHARLMAPQQSKKKQRAIIAADYEEIAERHFPGRLQNARATITSVGCWSEVSVAVDPTAGEDPLRLAADVQEMLQKYRRIGHIVKAQPPKYVGLQIAMTVCVRAGYLRAHVQRELLDQFSNRPLADGTKGFFHPDNFTFGDALYLSKLVVAAKRISGVENLAVTRFQRQGEAGRGELQAGVMRFGRFEIPRVDNDPLHPELGCFCLDVRGQR